MSQIPPALDYATPPPPQGTSGKAIGSLVCGILAVVACCAWWAAAPLGAAGVVLGVIARKEIEPADPRGRPSRAMALAGIITGAIGALLSVGLVVVGHYAGRALEAQVRELERQIEQQAQSATPPTTTTTSSPTTMPASP